MNLPGASPSSRLCFCHPKNYAGIRLSSGFLINVQRVHTPDVEVVGHAAETLIQPGSGAGLVVVILRVVDDFVVVDFSVVDLDVLVGSLLVYVNSELPVSVFLSSPSVAQHISRGISHSGR